MTILVLAFGLFGVLSIGWYVGSHGPFREEILRMRIAKHSRKLEKAKADLNACLSNPIINEKARY